MGTVLPACPKGAAQPHGTGCTRRGSRDQHVHLHIFTGDYLGETHEFSPKREDPNLLILRTFSPGTLLRSATAPFLPVPWEASIWGWPFWELLKLSSKSKSLQGYLSDEQGWVLITKQASPVLPLGTQPLIWAEPGGADETGGTAVLMYQPASPSVPPPLRSPPLKMPTNVNRNFFELFRLCPWPRVSHYMLKLPQMIPALHSAVIRGREKGETGGGFMFEMSTNNWFGWALGSESSEKNTVFWCASC